MLGYEEKYSRKVRLIISAVLSILIAEYIIDLMESNQLIIFLKIEGLILVLLIIIIGFLFETAHQAKDTYKLSIKSEIYYEFRSLLAFHMAIGGLNYLRIKIFIYDEFSFTALFVAIILILVLYLAYNNIINREGGRYKFVSVFHKLKKDREKKFDFFISYSRDESVFAKAIAKRLNEEGFKIWIDINENNMGDRIDENIINGMFLSQNHIIIFSKSYLQKDYTMTEYNVIREMYEKESPKIFPISYNVSSMKLKQKYPDMSSIAFFDLSKKPNLAYDVENIIHSIVSQIDKETPISYERLKRKEQINKKKIISDEKRKEMEEIELRRKITSSC